MLFLYVVVHYCKCGVNCSVILDLIVLWCIVCSFLFALSWDGCYWITWRKVKAWETNPASIWVNNGNVLQTQTLWFTSSLLHFQECCTLLISRKINVFYLIYLRVYFFFPFQNIFLGFKIYWICFELLGMWGLFSLWYFTFSIQHTSHIFAGVRQQIVDTLVVIMFVIIIFNHFLC